MKTIVTLKKSCIFITNSLPHINISILHNIINILVTQGLSTQTLLNYLPTTTHLTLPLTTIYHYTIIDIIDLIKIIEVVKYESVSTYVEKNLLTFSFYNLFLVK